ncbi:hypothetical protein GQ602_004632 [Ophiocordyceps camponoti-floridani]|uniref:Uncharacterized protein n=1 Tax=Ophiocordyceps camponoti-floridani TaxID=2030778 RepID=A0A8H4Q467_9HYPO|nr:hypothetical protein GQ602_004632 [Ophiocordyceps camponoti-floridani]
MPMFDDRFARQNRCEPPPEFPLASPYTGIVHLLSGPAPHAPTQIHPRTSGSVGGAPPLGGSPAFTFIARTGLTPEHSRARTTPWSVFQDGSPGHYASILADAHLGPPRGMARRAITLLGSHVPGAFVSPRADVGSEAWRSALARAPDDPRPESGRERFPFNNFTYCLTLFSKCFSSFDHSTCALSVSGRLGVRPYGALTLSGVPFQGTRTAPRQGRPLQIILAFRGAGFQI